MYIWNASLSAMPEKKKKVEIKAPLMENKERLYHTNVSQ